MKAPLLPSVVLVTLLLNLCTKDISVVNAFTTPINRSTNARIGIKTSLKAAETKGEIMKDFLFINVVCVFFIMNAEYHLTKNKIPNIKRVPPCL